MKTSLLCLKIDKEADVFMPKLDVCKNRMKYLGIHLAAYLGQLFYINYTPPINAIQDLNSGSTKIYILDREELH